MKIVLNDSRRELLVLVSETLEAAFGEEGDSEEEDAIVNQVLDEIGISLNERVFYKIFSFCE